MINNFILTSVAYAEDSEVAAGSEVNPLNMLLAIVYILAVMALIYVILLCIDKFARKNKKTDIPPEEKANEENTKDGAENE